MEIHRGWVIAPFVMASMVGCGYEVEPFGEGSVLIDWEVAPLGCADSGVEIVEISLVRDGGSLRDESECEKGGMRIDGLDPGKYEVSLRGFPSGEPATFAAEAVEVTVPPDGQARVEGVELLALPGAARIQWAFDNQKSCAANGVQELELTVFDAGLHETYRVVTACAAGEYEVESLRAGKYLFRLRAVDDAGHLEGVAEADLKKGTAVEVEVVL